MVPPKVIVCDGARFEKAVVVGAVIGLPEFEASQAGAVWRFRNEGNRASFVSHPEVYGPRFGGYDPVDLGRGVTYAGNPQNLAGVAGDPRVRQEVGRGWIDVEVMRLLNCRTLTRLEQGGEGAATPGAGERLGPAGGGHGGGAGGGCRGPATRSPSSIRSIRRPLRTAFSPPFRDSCATSVRTMAGAWDPRRPTEEGAGTAASDGSSAASGAASTN